MEQLYKQTGEYANYNAAHEKALQMESCISGWERKYESYYENITGAADVMYYKNTNTGGWVRVSIEINSQANITAVNITNIP
jgi:hypothetical protein